jgi:phospholipase C
VLTRREFLGAAAAAGTALAAFPSIRLGRAAGTPLRNIVLLMQENRSFDHYFGLFPGADGFPACSPVTHARDLCLGSPPHDIEAGRAELSGGADPARFQQLGGARALTYYTGADIPYYWALAERFTLCDRYFASVLGPTNVNRLFSIAAAAGSLRDNASLPTAVLPEVNIADRLDAGGVDWRCYVAHVAESDYNPLRYFANRRDDPRTLHPYADFLSDAAAGRLPPVSWIVTQDPLTEHGADDISWGERFSALTVNSLAASPQWKDSALILNYDEGGGLYDHVAPPQVDSLGLGFRVPATVVSPYAKRGHISSTRFDHCSVLALIEQTFGVRPLTERDARANPLEDAFDFSRRELEFVDYPERPLDSCGTQPADWYGDLLRLPVPRSGMAGQVPVARPLCASRPAPDLAGGAVAGAAVAGLGVAAAAALSARKRA